MAKPPRLADTNLVAFLKDFYSMGQLQIIYCTLTDGRPLPDTDEREREMRIDAIRQILGKPDPQMAVTVKSRKK